MSTLRLTAIAAALAVLIVFAPESASAQTREVATVDAATITFYEIMSIPEGGIPPALLEGAQAVAIVPGVLKAGFLAGIRYGEGVLTIRRADGGWSNPVFVTPGRRQLRVPGRGAGDRPDPGVQEPSEPRRVPPGAREVHDRGGCRRRGGAGRPATGGGDERPARLGDPLVFPESRPVRGGLSGRGGPGARLAGERRLLRRGPRPLGDPRGCPDAGPPLGGAAQRLARLLYVPAPTGLGEPRARGAGPGPRSGDRQ